MNELRSTPATRAVTLQDCVFLCCLPLLRDSFVSLRRTSEYCGRFIGWSQYQSALEVDRRMEELESLSGVGLRGSQAATFSKFKAAMDDRPPIVALLGHCRNGEEIEFADGFKSLHDVVSAIPPNFEGVLDVSVCCPQDLVCIAKKRAGNAVIRTARAELNGREWLLFYVMLFINIGRLGGYGLALLQTVNEFSQAKSSHVATNGGIRW